MNDSIKFLKNLICLDSMNPPGNELFVSQVIAEKLKYAGIEYQIYNFDHNRAYLLAKIKGETSKNSLAFVGHMDTVPIGEIPWKFNPLGSIESDGKIYGRGASDMKSGLAALVMAMIEVKNSTKTLKYDLILAATAGEEIDCIGAKLIDYDKALKDVGIIVIGEPTNGEIVIAHKGALWIEITSFGKSAHGSMPELGINAINNMILFINALNSQFKFNFDYDNLLGEPSLNIGTIYGGKRTNIVPDKCVLQIDIRTVPNQSHEKIIAEIKNIIDEIENNYQSKFELHVINNLISVKTPSNHPTIHLALNVANRLFQRKFIPKGVRYYTDASIFASSINKNTPILIYGPGNEECAHQADEYVEVDKYLSAIEFYKEFALEFLC